MGLRDRLGASIQGFLRPGATREALELRDNIQTIRDCSAAIQASPDGGLERVVPTVVQISFFDLPSGPVGLAILRQAQQAILEATGHSEESGRDGFKIETGSSMVAFSGLHEELAHLELSLIGSRIKLIAFPYGAKFWIRLHSSWDRFHGTAR